MPNHIMLIGTHAVTGMGRISCRNGSVERRKAANQPTKMPSGMPSAQAIR
jgi:hypothetical protein